jgi:proteasome lid subunit RPN8/RPN11
MHRFLKRQFRDLLRRAVRVAKSEQREVCGFLVENGFFLQTVEVKNVSRRRGNFVLSRTGARDVQRAASRLGSRVVGTFHSHVFGLAKPGESDIQGANRGELMLVFDTMDREARLWRIGNDRARELPFELI